MSVGREVRVLIVDDHPMVREILGIACSDRPSLRVVGMASDGHEAIEQCALVRPDVVVLDLGLPGLSGFEVLDHLREHFPSIRTLVVSGRDDRSAVFETVRRGARGFLVKTCSLQEVAAAAEAVAAGIRVFSVEHQRIAQEELRDMARRSRGAADALSALTRREVQLLELISHGMTTRRMATRLQITERTVATHIANLYVKLGVHSRVQAARCAAQLGLVDLDPRSDMHANG